MTDRFVNDGGDGTDGLTWATSEILWDNVESAVVAGDSVFFDSTHTETGGAGTNITIAVTGSISAVTRLISVTPSGAAGYTGPTPGAVVGSGSGVSALAITGSLYAEGITWQCGVGSTSNVNLSVGSDGAIQTYKDCKFEMKTTSASARIAIMHTIASGTNSCTVRWENCDVQFGATGQAIAIGGGDFTWLGGKVTSGGSVPTNLFVCAQPNVNAVITGVDFASGFSTYAYNLVQASQAATGKIVFKNCVLAPAGSSWTGVIGTQTEGLRIEAYNCGAAVTSGTNNYSLWAQDWAGSTKHETTIVRTGGASDGDTPISWVMESTANAVFPGHGHKSPDIFIPNTTSGASKTVTFHYVADENVAAGQGAGTSNAFTNAELAVEIEYLGTADSPKATFASSRATVIATPANNGPSSETWTTTGLTTPKKGSVAITFTPNEEGPWVARLVLYKASKKIYVCPEPVVS